MKWFEHLRIRYTLSHHALPHDVWENVTHKLDIFHGLSAVERAHLRELTTLLLHRKKFNGVQGLTINNEMAITISALACLPILKLGLDYYDGWIEVVLYPAAFRVSRNQVDSAGIISQENQVLSGESWSKGPLILSWDDVSRDIKGRRFGQNVVIHEFAHKLDALNGSANGMPPLHSNMLREQWTMVFTKAYESLQSQLLKHHHSVINPYAATNPAEFFAVLSEYFFTAPKILIEHYPAVYEQLALFYRQDTNKRMNV